LHYHPAITGRCDRRTHGLLNFFDPEPDFDRIAPQSSYYSGKRGTVQTSFPETNLYHYKPETYQTFALPSDKRPNPDSQGFIKTTPPAKGPPAKGFVSESAAFQIPGRRL